ncbi:MAG: hypothetical protein H6626_14965 [Pseudobdellovibrionaceae bacterium]|nr:hypothetical protein [Bdellovibrionales bacterium]USN47458.1 MAG: hypothetical protein H6626_14965 [Pseudobdellovibrionaceae bacterium]
MNNPKTEEQIVHYIEQSTGLMIKDFNQGRVEIQQEADGKTLGFELKSIEEVISRFDSHGEPFLQVNFRSGTKILLTERLVGFKPGQIKGLDPSRLPKVVTTPDLISVVEAIEDHVNHGEGSPEDIDLLKQVFKAVVTGAEAVGFDLSIERAWLDRIAKVNAKASA